MPTIRKTPKPADPNEQAPPAPAQAAPVEAIPPAPQPPPVRQQYKPPVQMAEPIDDPRSQEEVLHNVMVRQLADDLINPPDDDVETPALKLLAELQHRKDTGQSVVVLNNDIAAIVQSMEVEIKVTFLAYLSVQNRNLLGWMRSGDSLNKLLWRMCKRGDLKPHEAIVLKRLQLQEQQMIAEILRDVVNHGNVQLGDNALATMDYVVQVTDRSKIHKDFDKMTPQGREIYRKVIVRARRKMFPEQK